MSTSVNDDFDVELAALFDEVAAGIRPQGQVEAVLAGTTSVGTPTATTGVRSRSFRRSLAAAAAAVLVTAGGAAAYEVVDGEPDSFVSSDVTSVEATPITPPVTDAAADATPDVATDAVVGESAAAAGRPSAGQRDGNVTNQVKRRAELGAAALEAVPPTQEVRGTAAAGEQVTVASAFGTVPAVADGAGRWSATLTFTGATPGQKIPITVTFAGSDARVDLKVLMPGTPPVVEPPKTEPPKTDPTTTVPKPVADPAATGFTATLGWTEGDGTPLLVGLWGEGAPGSTITASTDRGTASTVAGQAGKWELVLELREVPPGAKVGVRVTSSASPKVHEFSVKGPVSTTPVVKPFTAQLGHSDLAAQPMKQIFFGTGTSGSTVRVASDYGTVEAVVGSNGTWEAKLKVEVPYGVVVGVRVTNTASDTVHEFTLDRPQPSYPFTAEAAFESCSDPIPFNEYWGKAAPGATITIQSPFGGTTVTAGGDGKWSARVEFPSAPFDQWFDVKVSSSQGGSVTFPFVRTTA